MTRRTLQAKVRKIEALLRLEDVLGASAVLDAALADDPSWRGTDLFASLAQKVSVAVQRHQARAS
jgi:hypothetical protein